MQTVASPQFLARTAPGNGAYRRSFSAPDGQAAGRYDRWLHRAPRRDRMPGNDGKLIDIVLGRPRSVTDNRRNGKGHAIARDHCEKLRRQPDDVLSRAPGNLNEPGWRHRDGNPVASRRDQRQLTRQQKRSRDVADRRDWPCDCPAMSRHVPGHRARWPHGPPALPTGRLAIIAAAHQTRPPARRGGRPRCWAARSIAAKCSSRDGAPGG